MKKVLSVLPMVAMLCFAVTVKADNGAIDNATLSAMGLGGVQVMSDSEAQSVRGQGYQPKRRSLALAFGISYAEISAPGAVYNGSGGSLGGGSAGTLDGFLSYGNYVAKGDHISEALITTTKTESTTVLGVTATTTTTRSLGIGAGGSASSFAL